MNNALSLIKYIFDKFVNLLFNDFQLFNNVTIGWVLVSIIIISIMIANILNAAKSSQSINIKRSDDN